MHRLVASGAQIDLVTVFLCFADSLQRGSRRYVVARLGQRTVDIQE